MQSDAPIVVKFLAKKLRPATVAGIPDCIVWRIGFTGELSYEIHVPAGHALRSGVVPGAGQRRGQ